MFRYMGHLLCCNIDTALKKFSQRGPTFLWVWKTLRIQPTNFLTVHLKDLIVNPNTS